MLRDLDEYTRSVNSEIENSDINSDNEGSSPSVIVDLPSRQENEPVGYSGALIEIADIKVALSSITSRSSTARRFSAEALAGFFGPDHDEIGRHCFLEWGLSGPAAESGGISQDLLNQEWQHQRLAFPKVTSTRSQALRILHLTKRQTRPLSDLICWPELTDRDNHNSPPIAKSQENIAWFLQHIGVRVYRDEFSGRNRVEGFERYDDLDDLVLNALWFRAEKAGLRPNFEYFASAVYETARQNARNPVKDYFSTVEWDEKPRLDSWLIDYAGAENSDLNREFGKLWLIAAVRRVRKPGTKFDQILVLEGEQGVGKSSLARILANAIGPGLFEDGLQLGAETKQVIELTRSKLIVEISELRGNNRDVEAIKAMLSRIEDSARLSYGRETSHVPRQFVMLGTTNSSEYLVDSTGNRRFWPVRVGRIDLKGLAADAPQLWAEAAFYEAQGISIELSEGLRSAASSEQSERVMGDPIFDAIAAHLGDDGGEVNMDTLFAMAGFDKSKLDRRNRAIQMAIGRAMGQMVGWRRVRQRESGQRTYVYKKDAAPELEFTWSAGHDGHITQSALRLGSGDGRVVPYSTAKRRTAGSAVPTGPTAVPTKSDR